MNDHVTKKNKEINFHEKSYFNFFCTIHRFYTKYVSEVESDPVGDFTRCRLALADLGMTNVSDEDCSALR